MVNKYQWTPEELAAREARTKQLDAEAAALWAAKYPKAAKRREASKAAAARRADRVKRTKAEEAEEAAAATRAAGRVARAAYMTAETKIWSAAFHRVKRRPSDLGGAEAIARNKAEALNAAAWAVERWAAHSVEALRLKAAADAEEAAAFNLLDGLI